MAFMQKFNNLKNKAVDLAMNYSEIEVKVRQATDGNEPWGPHGTLMSELSQATYSYEDYPEVMGMLWRRILKDREGKNWRQIYKGLLLLHYLIRNGTTRVVDSARDHVYDLRQLERFKYIDEKGKDQGINVAHKAKEICDLLADDEMLHAERKKARKTRDKFKGIGSSSVSYHPGGMSGGRRFDDMAPTRRYDDMGGSRRSRFRDIDSDEEADDARVDQSSSSSSRGDQYSARVAKHREENKLNTKKGGDGDDDDFAALRGAKKEEPKQAGGLVDLLGDDTTTTTNSNSNPDDFGADFNPRGATAAATTTKADDFGAFSSPSTAGNTDFANFASAPTASDDFGAFTAPAPAAPQPTTSNAQQQQSSGGGDLLGDLFGASSSSSSSTMAPTQQHQTASLMDMGSMMTPTTATATTTTAPSTTATTTATTTSSKSAASKPNFGRLKIDLDNLSLASKEEPKKPATSGSVFGEPSKPQQGSQSMPLQQQPGMMMMGGGMQGMAPQQPPQPQQPMMSGILNTDAPTAAATAHDGHAIWATARHSNP
ncbi:hypothetical protein PTSG_09102 [Salpingoeca rosetta]|uniref:ENTH domain-containing protein n=1 Tax=Salpingoeca rosetta (strain ATCC 50818 / BSB-021) TaxID=946362 RepID=F2UMQ7_SALR5|nr:uncharacterized protein PTSG_09102 [Salpingoeca rosetta]EGD78406.1 hypothetical protein PTSG_09102 [Salpingoeca rosetta]|eukprot:XP_004989355.1 hypothetical protein PTSG_09102 [Salpingoeca rosetta]